MSLPLPFIASKLPRLSGRISIIAVTSFSTFVIDSFLAIPESSSGVPPLNCRKFKEVGTASRLYDHKLAFEQRRINLP